MKRDSTRGCRQRAKPGGGLLGLALVLTVFSFPLGAHGQYGFDHWTVQDGLPQDIMAWSVLTESGSPSLKGATLLAWHRTAFARCIRGGVGTCG
jgi:hypothetical protein